MKNSKNIYQYRHLVQITLEAKTPIAISSGERDFITDAVILKDINGLPYIPGTSIAGVIRHGIGHKKSNDLFGYNDRKKPEDSIGSNIIFSNALMIGKDGKVIEGLQQIDFINDDFYNYFLALPIRQHNSINSKGTVRTDGGKFDEQVVYKGTRYLFEIELLSSEAEDKNLNNIINFIHSDEFRIGSGTRIGFGQMEVITCKQRSLNIKEEKDLEAYINKSSSLNNNDFWANIESESPKVTQATNWDKYKLSLTPDDFFLFGSGFGSDDADMTPVRESIIIWEDGKPQFKDAQILIPASSIKGAISHRVAYHYNRLEGVHADIIFDELKSKLEEENLSDREFNKKLKEQYEKVVGENNTAVRELFGASGMQDDTKQERGNVLFSDLFIDNKEVKEKILNHVSIDRFTGGAIDGALFQEEVVFGENVTFTLDIMVNKLEEAQNKKIYSENVINAFEATLTDITNGMLPLGGGVNRGHGSFSGTITCNDKPLKLN